jgi:hypothetical protein
MRRRFAPVRFRISACALTLCAAALAPIALSSLTAAEQTAGRDTRGGGDRDRRIVLTVKDLMESIIDPSADVIWGAVGTVADKQGVRDLSPKTPEDWLDLRRAAVRLVEGGNLLMMPGRAAAPAGVKSDAPGVELEPAEIAVLIGKEREGFDAFAMALQSVGVEALQAIEAKNADRLIEVGGRMEEVCESCHQTFWYPHEQAAPRN